jgi:gp16 family phage-associated protein
MTAAQRHKIRAELDAKGITLKALCQQKNASYQAARDLLCGRTKGRWGEAHKAAVALGLKPDPATLGFDAQPSK